MFKFGNSKEKFIGDDFVTMQEWYLRDLTMEVEVIGIGRQQIKYTPDGFYLDLSLEKSDNYWFNEFIKTKEYKKLIRKIKLEKLK